MIFLRNCLALVLGHMAVPAVALAVTSAAMEQKSEHRLNNAANNISLEIGLLNNADTIGQTTQYSSMGLRYGYAFMQDIALSSANFHDQLVGEAGVFFYSVIGFRALNDEASVVPAIGTLRYTVSIGEIFAPFVYAGVMKNFSDQDSLTTTRAAVGAGAMLNFGKTWSIRAEYGSDAFAAGAVARL